MLILLCHEPRREYPRQLIRANRMSQWFKQNTVSKPCLLRKINLPFVLQEVLQPVTPMTHCLLFRPLFHTHLGSTLSKNVFRTVAAFGTHTNPHRFSLCFQTLLTTSPSHRTQRILRLVINGFQPFQRFLSDSQISYQLLRNSTPPLSCSIHRIRLPYCIGSRFHGSEIPKQVRYPHQTL